MSEKKEVIIYNRYTKAVIYKCEADNLKSAVIKAVNRGADLRGAYLMELISGELISITLAGHYPVVPKMLRLTKKLLCNWPRIFVLWIAMMKIIRNIKSYYCRLLKVATGLKI